MRLIDFGDKCVPLENLILLEKRNDSYEERCLYIVYEDITRKSEGGFSWEKYSEKLYYIEDLYQGLYNEIVSTVSSNVSIPYLLEMNKKEC